METTFENAKTGDRVWDFNEGWGEVQAKCNDDIYPIKVCFENRYYIAYSFDGSSNSQVKKTLFWDELKYEIPVRPKRIVKKTIMAYAVVYDENNYRIYADKQDADIVNNNTQKLVKLTGEYEVEE